MVDRDSFLQISFSHFSKVALKALVMPVQDSCTLHLAVRRRVHVLVLLLRGVVTESVKFVEVALAIELLAPAPDEPAWKFNFLCVQVR